MSRVALTYVAPIAAAGLLLGSLSPVRASEDAFFESSLFERKIADYIASTTAIYPPDFVTSWRLAEGHLRQIEQTAHGVAGLIPVQSDLGFRHGSVVQTKATGSEAVRATLNQQLQVYAVLAAENLVPAVITVFNAVDFVTGEVRRRLARTESVLLLPFYGIDPLDSRARGGRQHRPIERDAVFLGYQSAPAPLRGTPLIQRIQQAIADPSKGLLDRMLHCRRTTLRFARATTAWDGIPIVSVRSDPPLMRRNLPQTHPNRDRQKR